MAQDNDEPETVTFELPLTADNRITVDALFTALDHASAYHGHEGQYSELYGNMEDHIWEQVQEQLQDEDNTP